MWLGVQTGLAEFVTTQWSGESDPILGEREKAHHLDMDKNWFLSSRFTAIVVLDESPSAHLFSLFSLLCQ